MAASLALWLGVVSLCLARPLVRHDVPLLGLFAGGVWYVGAWHALWPGVVCRWLARLVISVVAGRVVLLLGLQWCVFELVCD